MKVKHLLKTRDFADILKTSRKESEELVSVRIRPGEKKSALIRVGIIISKKFAPKAVDRNYMRRIIYAYFSKHGQAFNKEADIIVRLEKNTRSLSKTALSREIRKELKNLTEKKGLIV
ncbi:MAG: ribonuclease P protein component [Candidatus Omnitrophota bacterium]